MWWDDYFFGERMLRYWFGDLTGGSCIPFQSRDPETIARRLDQLRREAAGTTAGIPLRWEMAHDCGFIGSRGEYLQILRDACAIHAEAHLAEEAGRPDRELVQMVRMLDQVDESANLLTERALEWYAALDPAFTRKYRRIRGPQAVSLVRESGNPLLLEMAAGIDRLVGMRVSLAEEIHARAATLLPNSSALVGGLVAARLLSAAGDLPGLDRMPSSAIQVLGARAALFSHLRTGTPPPKHGIIYQHQRVHRARRAARGRVARVLAAKLAIAARIDWYRGQPDPAFLASSQEAVDRAGGGR